MSYELIILGEPVSKGRPRLGKGGRVYTPKQTVEAETLIGWTFRRSVGPLAPPTADVGVSLAFHTATGGRRDLDNMIKLVLDGLNGVAWRDDIQVVKIEATVARESKPPRTEITIYPIGDAQ